MNTNIFKEVKLDSEHSLLFGNLPRELITNDSQFSELWSLHPSEYHDIEMYGKLTKTPRWQQAYGKDYKYSGSKNNALPIPLEINSYLSWVKENIENSANGVLINWYDGSLGHYIGKHQDNESDLSKGCVIISISFGQERLLRMRPYRKSGYRDFKILNGSVYVIPYSTNLKWQHEIPHFKKYEGKRISLTFRSFVG